MCHTYSYTPESLLRITGRRHASSIDERTRGPAGRRGAGAGDHPRISHASQSDHQPSVSIVLYEPARTPAALDWALRESESEAEEAAAGSRRQPQAAAGPEGGLEPLRGLELQSPAEKS